MRSGKDQYGAISVGGTIIITVDGSKTSYPKAKMEFWFVYDASLPGITKETILVLINTVYKYISIRIVFLVVPDLYYYWKCQYGAIFATITTIITLFSDSGNGLQLLLICTIWRCRHSAIITTVTIIIFVKDRKDAYPSLFESR